MKQLTEQQTAIVLYRGAIQPANIEEEPDIPLSVLFYCNLVQDWEAEHPGWYTEDDSFDDPYEALRTDEAYEERCAMWRAEAERMEADCWRRLGPGAKGWRLINGRYEIGNMGPGVQVLRPEHSKLPKSKRQLEGR